MFSKSGPSVRISASKSQLQMSSMSSFTLEMKRAIFIPIPSELGRMTSSPKHKTKPIKTSANIESIKYFVMGKSALSSSSLEKPSISLIPLSNDANL